MRKLGLLLLLACSHADNNAVESPEPHGRSLDDIKVDGTETVASYEWSEACTTGVVMGLARQIADEVDCVHPGTNVRFQPIGGITFFGDAVLPYLERAARTHLYEAAAEGPLVISSAYRTPPQQWLLWRWNDQGRCDIPTAAFPGRSNHETGRAIDLVNWDVALPILPTHGWKHNVPGDDYHFEHLASPDNRGQDVIAFKRLWNRNHPDDPVPETVKVTDGTLARLVESPAAGFPIGSCRRVDNVDPEFSISEGEWMIGNAEPGFYGDDYAFIGADTPGVAIWIPELPSAGRYQLTVTNAPATDRSSHAAYQIRHGTEAEAIDLVADQRTAFTIDLGAFDLDPGDSVVLSNAGADGVVVADSLVATPTPIP